MRRSSLMALAALTLAFAFALTPCAARACSICLAGDPTIANLGVQSAHAGQWRFTIENRSHSKTNAIEDLPSETEFEHENRVMVMASWAPTDRLVLGVNVPYLDRRHRALEENPQSGLVSRRTEIAQSIGDVEVQGRYEFVRSRALTRYVSTAALAGLAMPTGPNGMEYQGQPLDEHVQPGSGAWAAFGGVAELAHWTRRWAYASVIGRLPGTNSRGYQYGKSLLVNIELGQRLGTRFDVIGGLVGRMTGRDLYKNTTSDGSDPNTYQPESGGRIAFVTPAVQARLTPAFSARVQGYLPVWNDLNGTQDEDPNLLVSFTYAR